MFEGCGAQGQEQVFISCLGTGGLTGEQGSHLSSASEGNGFSEYWLSSPGAPCGWRGGGSAILISRNVPCCFCNGAAQVESSGIIILFILCHPEGAQSCKHIFNNIIRNHKTQ